MKPFIRSYLKTQSREWALKNASSQLEFYLSLAERLSDTRGTQIVEVPRMQGVDEDMTHWSFYMLLAHNTIVNQAITSLTVQLAKGEELHGPAVMDPKHDVLPGPSVGEEQVQLFQESVESHLSSVQALEEIDLRKTPTADHPLFGPFTAHMWNGMFAFHLRVHNKQARMIVEGASGLSS